MLYHVLVIMYEQGRTGKRLPLQSPYREKIVAATHLLQFTYMEILFEIYFKSIIHNVEILLILLFFA